MSQAPSLRPVTAVIITYQSARTVARTLAATRRCCDENLLDVIIVDNNSTDGTRDIIEGESAWARLLLTGRNIGFARGCNIGLAQVRSPYTIFLNPDAVVEPEAIRTMLLFFEQHPRAGIVGPATICGENDTDKVLQSTGRLPSPWTILRNAIPGLGSRADTWEIVPGSAPARTGWVSGGVFMVRTSLMRQLNGFDPRFFLYWEEMDVCKRAEDAGFENWVLGTALAHHVVGASASPAELRIGPCIAKHYLQSRYYYMVKHHGRFAATIAELGEFIALFTRSAVDVVRGRGWNRLRPRLQASLLSMPEQEPVER